MPEIVTGRSAGLVSEGQAGGVTSTIEKMRLCALPSMISCADPGPWIVTASVTEIDPVVSVMMPVTPKVIVSAPAAALASMTACRRLPGPESSRFVTVNVAPCADDAARQTHSPNALSRMTPPRAWTA